jgi:hypothetical protein
MKFLNSPIEYAMLGVFILFLIIPVKIPLPIAQVVDSPLGMIMLFLATMALFVYVNPILGILYIFVAYELLRRSGKITGKSAYIEYTPSQTKKDEIMKQMNPPMERSLEEIMVDKMSPVGQSEMLEYVNTGFKPVSDKTFGASEI